MIQSANKYNQDSIVGLALKIQACVHFSVHQPIMCGADTLDMQPVNNEKFSIHGKTPIPSVLDYQLDTGNPICDTSNERNFESPQKAFQNKESYGQLV